MLFPFPQSYFCKKDETLTVEVDVKPLAHNHRALAVNFKVINEGGNIVVQQVYSTE
jgi:hypothetical protein